MYKRLLLCTVLFFAVTTLGKDQSPLSTQANDEPSILPKGDAPNTSGAFDLKLPKRMWADSYLWAKAPELDVEEWIGEKPDTKGKYVIIEVWNTWCPHCWKSTKKLNKWHKKYKDELVIIGITDEPREVIEKFNKVKIKYYSAIDTQKRFYKKLGVWGIPHAIVIEPEGHVIWEGFPLLKDHELTEDKLKKILEVGRKEKARKAAEVVKAADSE